MKHQGKVVPKGFFRRFLEKQMTGLTGHIEKAGYPFDRVEWGAGDYLSDNGNEQWWVYEQTAYWLDGFTRCAILLEDREALRRASDIIWRVLNHPEADGYLGPHFLKKTDGWNRWPHVVFFRACMALYDYTGDERIPLAIERHYLYSPCDYSGFRDILNCEIMLWAYGILNHHRLLQMAIDAYDAYNAKCDSDLCDRVAVSPKKPYAHGVSYNEYSKLGAIFYTYTGDTTYLNASWMAYKKIDLLFMLPGGCNCSDEFMISNRPMHSIETCDVSDYTWSLHYLLETTGQTEYADRIEKCIFNAGIGAVTEDFRALQYFSCANQLILDEHSNHNAFYRGNGWMQYAPNPGTECCPGNVNRFMPNYLLNAWRADGHTVTCQLFADSSFSYSCGNDKVEIREKTNYPFREEVEFSIKAKGSFTLNLRVPGWAKNPMLRKGETEVFALKKHDTFIPVLIEGKCTLRLTWDSVVTECRSGGGVYYEKGPLVYSLGMKGNREKTGLKPDFPVYRMTPDREWRYGIIGDPVYHDCPDAFEMNLDSPLPYITVRGLTLSGADFCRVKHVRRTTNLYQKTHESLIGDFVFTPSLVGMSPSENDREEMLTLYPYAACKLRMTVLPKYQYATKETTDE